MTCGIFKRMEEYEESIKNYKVIQKSLSGSSNGISCETPTSPKDLQFDASIADHAAPIKTLSNIDQPHLQANSSSNLDKGTLDKAQAEYINKSVEKACKYYVVNLIDDVCLYQAKKETVTTKFENEEGLSETEKEQKIKSEIERIPERSCPPHNQSLDNRYKHKIPTKVKNESGATPGEFGWCVVCRKSADRYCRDLRVPVCNHECKIKHLQENGKKIK